MTFPHTASIRRKSKAGTKYTFVTVGTTPCFIQPIDTEFAQDLGASFTKALVCYLPETATVQEGDRLEANDSMYGVSGVRHHNYGGIAHKRALLEVL